MNAVKLWRTVAFVLVASVCCMVFSPAPVYSVHDECKVVPGVLTKAVTNECQVHIKTLGCRGDCHSSTKPVNHTSGHFVSSCSCCAPIEYKRASYLNTCAGKGAARKYFRVRVPVRCRCRPCS